MLLIEPECAPKVVEQGNGHQWSAGGELFALLGHDLAHLALHFCDDGHDLWPLQTTPSGMLMTPHLVVNELGGDGLRLKSLVVGKGPVAQLSRNPPPEKLSLHLPISLLCLLLGRFCLLPASVGPVEGPVSRAMRMQRGCQKLQCLVLGHGRIVGFEEQQCVAHFYIVALFHPNLDHSSALLRSNGVLQHLDLTLHRPFLAECLPFVFILVACSSAVLPISMGSHPSEREAFSL